MYRSHLNNMKRFRDLGNSDSRLAETPKRPGEYPTFEILLGGLPSRYLDPSEVQLVQEPRIASKDDSRD